MSRERIVAVGLLTQEHLDRLGPTLTQVWPIDESPSFDELLGAIDAADAKATKERSASREEWVG